MARLALQFDYDLSGFLAPSQRGGGVELVVDGTPSIKDVIESLGVPHTEPGIILVNHISVPFTYLARDGDRIEVYSAGRTASTPSLGSDRGQCPLQPPPPSPIRFILDVHLGRLAAYLRMLGFDTLYQNHCDDLVLAQTSCDQQRILLTRDVGLLKRAMVTYGYFVRQTRPVDQLEEVIRRYGLAHMFEPFKRCMRCNGLLEPVERATVVALVPENISQRYDTFQQCQSCRQIYWKGAHFQRMQSLTEQVLASVDVTAR